MDVLSRLLDSVVQGGWLLLADEASNTPGFRKCLAAHNGMWTIAMDRRGFLFARRGLPT